MTSRLRYLVKCLTLAALLSAGGSPLAPAQQFQPSLPILNAPAVNRASDRQDNCPNNGPINGPINLTINGLSRLPPVTHNPLRGELQTEEPRDSRELNALRRPAPLETPLETPPDRELNAFEVHDLPHLLADNGIRRLPPVTHSVSLASAARRALASQSPTDVDALPPSYDPQNLLPCLPPLIPDRIVGDFPALPPDPYEAELKRLPSVN